jgi:hypothetical protein
MSIRVEELKPQFGSIVHTDKSALLDADTVTRCRELPRVTSKECRISAIFAINAR